MKKCGRGGTDGWIDGMGVYGGVREWSWGVLDGFGMNEIITETAAKKKGS